MKSTIVILLVLCSCAGAASAFVWDVVLPETAVTGETVVPWIPGTLADSCWSFESVEVSEGSFLMLIEITLRYDRPPGMMCLGVSEDYDVYPELVFGYPGVWTVRVVEHVEHSDDPDYPDQVLERTLEVSGPVVGETASFGRIKAQYR